MKKPAGRRSKADDELIKAAVLRRDEKTLQMAEEARLEGFDWGTRRSDVLRWAKTRVLGKRPATDPPTGTPAIRPRIPSP